MADLDSTLLDLSSNFKTQEQAQLQAQADKIFIPTQERSDQPLI